MKLLGPAEIRDLAHLLGITPTKKLGQNFVIDANTVRRIVRVGGVRAGDQVVEIGPGLGSLTLGLLEAGASVVAVEIDGRLAEQLSLTIEASGDPAGDPAGDSDGDSPGERRSGAERLTVLHADAMRITELPGRPTRLVANLPYNVSVPVLLHFLEHFPSIASGVVMVQAEVGQRIAAPPGSKIYGSPSVKAAWYGRWRTAGVVSRQVFWPVPNVDSILVAFDRNDEQPGDETVRRRTFALVDAAFGQRRKMLRQSLSAALGGAGAASAILEAAGIDPTWRGEQLGMAEFVAIARLLPAADRPVAD